MWQEQILSTADGKLFWFSKGTGKPLIFLHGGPGDECRYLLPFAEAFTSHFRCIAYDQRGSGGSTLERLDERSLHPERFVADLEQLHLELMAKRLSLVGHSWGAMLALLYGAAHPARVERLVLIGLGPLNDEMRGVAKANRMKPLSSHERQAYVRLTVERQEALKAGDSAEVAAINRRRAMLGFRAVFHDQDLAASHFEDWLAREPYRNWCVNQIVNRLLDYQALWARLPELRAPMLVLYGYQDFEPITQAYMLRDRMPEAALVFINECGHVPWLEQPEKVAQAVMGFLIPRD